MPAEFHYFPFDEGPGSESDEQRWGDMMKWMRTTGIITENLVLDPIADDLAVTANATLGVQTAIGKAWIEGFFFEQRDDYYGISVNPNTSGDPRIDLLTVELNKPDSIISYVVVEGTPDPSPVAPLPQQDDDIWQLPLAEIEVADGAAVILPGDITDVRVRSTQGDGGSSAVTLTSAAGDESLVQDGVGPDLITKSLSAGTNISLSSDADTVTISAVATPTDSPVCILTLSMDQMVANGDADDIVWDTAIFDPDNMWDGMTEITIPEDGLYEIKVNVAWTGNVSSNGVVSAYAVLGGVTTLTQNMCLAIGDVSVSNNSSAIVDLSAMDVITVVAENNSGVSLNVDSVGDHFPYVSVIKVRS